MYPSVIIFSLSVKHNFSRIKPVTLKHSHTREETQGQLREDFLERVWSSLLQDRMDMLARIRGASQADKRHDKSNPVYPTQRTGFCGAEMTRTEEFTEGLESQRAHWELMGWQ